MNYTIKYSTILILIFLVTSCKNPKIQPDTKVVTSSDNSELKIYDDLIVVSKKQFESGKMKLVNIQNFTFPTYIKTTGTIDVPPSSKAIISTFIGGYIKKSPLLIGDTVKKGQALVTIESLEIINLQQEYMEVKEQLIYLELEYERQKELFEEKITSKKKFLKSESDYKKTYAMYNGLRKKLQLLHINPTVVEEGDLTSLITIYAPIAGSITDVNISTGTYVSPADKIMEIINIKHIHLELKIFEKDVLNIKKGQKVIFRIPESSNNNFNGEIHLIGKSIDENRTVQVHVHIDHEIEQNFIIGMFVDADIIIEDNVSKALPQNVFIEANSKNYVLLLKSEDENNYSFLKKELITGKTSDGFTEILDKNLIIETSQFLYGGYNLISE